MNPNDRKKRLTLVVIALAVLLAVAAGVLLSGKGTAGEKAAGEEKEHSEGQELTLTSEEAARAGIKAEAIQPQKMAARCELRCTFRSGP